MEDRKQKEKVQVLLYNRKRELIRKINVNRNAVIDSKWMKAIDNEAVYFEKSK